MERPIVRRKVVFSKLITGRYMDAQYLELGRLIQRAIDASNFDTMHPSDEAEEAARLEHEKVSTFIAETVPRYRIRRAKDD